MEDFQPGSVIAARYRVVRFLGGGAVSTVYETVDEGSAEKSRVAVKVMHSELSESEEVVTRFEREAVAASRIGSPHIMRVLGSGVAPEGHFMVLEYLEGDTLQSRLRKKKSLPPEEAALLAWQLLSGLSMAHDLGIVHRDLKPANLMLVRAPSGGDFLKILDFGASKLASASSAITSLGAMVGTPMYMSPEQIRNSANVDARADIYACGVILFQSITGKLPFDARNPAELAFRVVTQDPPPLETHVPSIDPELSELVRRAMAREASARFQTAAEMLVALQGWLEKRGVALPSHPRLTAPSAPAFAPPSAPAAAPAAAFASAPVSVTAPAPAFAPAPVSAAAVAPVLGLSRDSAIPEIRNPRRPVFIAVGVVLVFLAVLLVLVLTSQ